MEPPINPGRFRWLVPVEFTELDADVRPKDFIKELRSHLPERYSPLQSNGNGNQGVYLTPIPQGFANVLLDKIGKPASFFTMALGVDDEKEDDREQEKAQKALEGRTDIGATQKQQLILSRRGQGIFKVNVRLNETRCRLTAVKDTRMLIASHIKPWAKSSDKEKLDGCNGLLLSPHVDKLFDRGFISFENDGAILISSKIEREVLRQWAIDKVTNVGPFTDEQCVYLLYHRENKFKR